MMCEYAGVDYEAKNYDARPKEGGGWDVTDWYGVKPALYEKNSLMNLPYVIDGEYVIAQTNACFTHLARVLGLYGSCYLEQIKVEQCLCQAMDLRNDVVPLFYGPAPEDQYKGHLEGKLKTHFAKFEDFLAQGGTTFLCAETPTAPDFHLFEMIDQHELVAAFFKHPSPVAAYPKLSVHYAAVKALPQLQSYFAGDLYKLPCNNKMANWGARPDGSAW